jgi:hypothetical protein
VFKSLVQSGFFLFGTQLQPQHKLVAYYGKTLKNQTETAKKKTAKNWSKLVQTGLQFELVRTGLN